MVKGNIKTTVVDFHHKIVATTLIASLRALLWFSLVTGYHRDLFSARNQTY